MSWQFFDIWHQNYQIMLIILTLICLIPSTLQISNIFLKIPPVDFNLADAEKDDVVYHLFKSSSQTTALVLNNDFILPDEDKNKPMKILIHGFVSNVDSPWYNEMKTEYFKKGPHNIIYSGWSKPSNKMYNVSAANIKPVGEYIAEFIVNMRVPLKNVHLIGHSLGSHLAGFVGKNVYKKTGTKIARITATDPAGPAFETVGPEKRLNKDDATFVDVIHTDMGYGGTTKPIGHVDFYVNGGHNQPGCPSHQMDRGCSHARSNYYFTESINTNNITARKAKINGDGEVVLLPNPEEIVFGDSVNNAARGIYFLTTANTPPYLITQNQKND